MKPHYTYVEGGRVYAVITLPCGMTYYAGPFLCRDTARRFAKQENARHEFAERNGLTYNARYL